MIKLFIIIVFFPAFFCLMNVIITDPDESKLMWLKGFGLMLLFGAGCLGVGILFLKFLANIYN